MSEELEPVLARLNPPSFADEVLGRVQQRMDADTIAMLLVERGGTHLVARAARGLEEEVYQGVRVPLGSGFAGRIAATRQPVVLDHVGPDTVVNPILWRKGVRSMLGVPLIADQRLVGVLHVGTLGDRKFTAEDAAYLQQAADRIAAALNTQQTVAERTAAQTLQLSLLPSKLPHLRDLEFASRFVAAEDFGVGGDWFDVFELPDTSIGIVMGDVAGSGLTAAVVMGRLRSALRAYAIESRSPSEALHRLDRKFAHFEPDEMATVLYAIVAPDRKTITVSSTGHPPPILARVDAPAEVVDCAPSAPIGSHVHSTRVDVMFELPLGATVGFYTDGLIERRGESIHEGLERLRRAFFAADPEVVCRQVMSDMVGATVLHDDTALLVVRRAERDEA